MSAADPLREAVLAELQKLVDPATFAAWHRNLQFVPLAADRFRVALPNEIYRHAVERRLRPALEQAFQTATGRSVVLDFAAGAEASGVVWPAAAPEPPPPAAAPPPATRARPRLNENYTFDNFVEGPSNRLAHAAAVAVADSPGKAWNPLFIHGDVGLGKTHLLQAICHSLLRQNPDLEILYLPCESFVNAYISAVQKRELEIFRNRFRNADVLLIDDIHFLSDKEGSQEEFFHTFNALHDANRQIVLSSDSPAKDIPRLKDRLLSRFRWGLDAPMEAPTFEMRVAILRRKAESRGREIPEEVLSFVASAPTTNIREMEGNITRVLALASLRGHAIDLALAQEALRDTLNSHPRPLPVSDIQQCVCEFYKLKMADLLSRKRSKTCSLPRQVAIFLAKEMTDMSLTDIGAAFGRKDHTTVIYSIQKIRALLASDPRLKSAVDSLLTSLQRQSRR